MSLRQRISSTCTCQPASERETDVWSDCLLPGGHLHVRTRETVACAKQRGFDQLRPRLEAQEYTHTHKHSKRRVPGHGKTALARSQHSKLDCDKTKCPVLCLYRNYVRLANGCGHQARLTSTLHLSVLCNPQWESAQLASAPPPSHCHDFPPFRFRFPLLLLLLLL